MAGYALTPTVLSFTTSGIVVPKIGSSKTLVKVILRVPALNAGTHTIATSDDGGTTWTTALGALALTGYEPANPTAATSTGGFRAMYGPYLPGTQFRITSSVAQAATCSAYFGI